MWQDYGTGRETPRKSSVEGELAHTSAETQPALRWDTTDNAAQVERKYYASVMNIKEFYEDNIGRSFTGILSNAINKNFGRSG